MSDQVSVFASFRPKQESQSDFLELMQMMVEKTRQETGCARYDLYSDPEGGYHLFEIYNNEAALQAHRDADHYKSYRANVADMLEESIGVRVLNPVDVKG